MKKVFPLFLVALLAAVMANAQNDHSQSTLPGKKLIPGKKADNSAPKEKPSVEDVIIVYKTHFDIGYTDWADNVKSNYATKMVEGALDIIDRSKQMPVNQQFKWIIAGWPMKEMLTNATPEVRSRIVEAIREKAFTVHALPFTFETEACEPESIVRSLGYSSEIAKNAGIPLPIDAKQTDVPSHSWLLPTILSHAGIKFLHIGCNPASRSPELPLLFWWEGPDQSRLMTMYFGPYYGTTPAPPQGWPFKTWLAIIHTNDNVGAPTYPEFVKAIQDIEKANPGAKVRTGSMADFYNALMAENPDLPVVRGDMPDTWIHGYMSMPREVKSSRKMVNDMVSLEKLNTLLPLWGGKPDPKISRIEKEAYEKVHLFNEHTFGLAMSHGHSGYWAYGNDFETQRAMGFYDPIEFSWQEKGLHIKNAEQLVIPALSRKIKELAEAVNIEGERIVVFNPLPWDRSGLVTIQTGNDVKKALQNTVTGEFIRIAKDKNIVRFFAKDIPALGYTTFIPVDTEVNTTNDLQYNAEKFELENLYFRIRVDSGNGTIHSLLDKKTGKELVSVNEEWKFGQYVREKFSRDMTDQYARDYVKNKESTWGWAYPELGRINLSDTPYSRTSGKKPAIEIGKDNISVSARIHFEPDGQNMHKYSVIITLYNNQPFVELTWSINGKPADPWPEGGWITFPFNISNASFRLGRPGAIVDPATDYIRSSNHDYCFLNTGMSILDDKNQGIGIMSPDVPAISLDRPGLWKYTPGFVPRRPNVFFNLYNNQWSTNFTEWIEGSWNARFYIWTFDHFSNEQSIITPSGEFRNPLIASFATVKPGPLPVSGSGIKLSRKGIAISAFGPDPDGNGTILRLWEQAGDSGNLEIILPPGSKYITAQPVTLRGEKQGASIPVKDGRFLIVLKACSPASFVLQ